MLSSKQFLGLGLGRGRREGRRVVNSVVVLLGLLVGGAMVKE